MSIVKVRISSLQVGDKIYFKDEKRGFEIKARSKYFIIATKVHFDTCCYTIIDLALWRMGPNNLIFNVYDYTKQKDILKCLKDLNDSRLDVEVSQRNGACVLDKLDRFKLKKDGVIRWLSTFEKVGELSGEDRRIRG